MAGRETERTHAGYFDYLRLIAAFSGIFMHTAAGGLRTEVNAWQELLNAAGGAAFTAVPLLWMTSGCLLLSSERTAGVRFWPCKRLPRLEIFLAGWRRYGAWVFPGGLRWGARLDGAESCGPLSRGEDAGGHKAAVLLIDRHLLRTLPELQLGSYGPRRPKAVQKSPAGGPSAQNPHLTSRLFCACFYTGRSARDSAHGAEKGGDE